MGISHVRNNNCRHTCTRLAKKSRPEVGYWVTLEGHHQNVGDAKDGRHDYHTPDCDFLICFDAYLQQEKSNAGFYQSSGCDVGNLATKPPLCKVRIDIGH